MAAGQTEVNGAQIERLTKRGAEVVKIDDTTPFVVISDDDKIEYVKQDLANPKRKTGRRVVYDVESFLAEVTIHKTLAMTILANVDDRKVVAIYNDHKAKLAGHQDHKTELDCALTDEWSIWMDKNKEMMTQAEFVDFIEENLAEIINPDHSTMLEIASSLEVKKKVNFGSSIKTQNGSVQFRYDEEVSGTTKAGTLEVPEFFELGIAPFEGAEKFKLVARLRYRLRGGDLSIGYMINRPDDVVKAAFKDVTAAIEKGAKLKPLMAQL